VAVGGERGGAVAVFPHDGGTNAGNGVTRTMTST